MGVSIGWVAVQHVQADEVVSRLRLNRTGRLGAFDYRGVACHALGPDWFLVMAGRCDHRIVQPASMAALSRGGRAVLCAVEEHVNFALAEFWEDGASIWQVQHQGDEDNENLSFRGRPPPGFDALVAGVESEDSNNLDGYFHMDIPLILAKACCGFRHDETNDAFDATPFEMLDNPEAERKWWQRWKR